MHVKTKKSQLYKRNALNKTALFHYIKNGFSLKYKGKTGIFSWQGLRESNSQQGFWREYLFCFETPWNVVKSIHFKEFQQFLKKDFSRTFPHIATCMAQNWHNFFRRIIEMAENRRKQQKSMSLSLTSETAVEYTIWPANDTYIITVCWVMKNREKQMISTS